MCCDSCNSSSGDARRGRARRDVVLTSNERPVYGRARSAKSEALVSSSHARRDVVLTDREGRPFNKPRRADYRSEDDYLDAYDDYRRRIAEAMSSRGMELSLERDASRRSRPRARRARRDPSNDTSALERGALYHLEWETVDGESGVGEYVYEGVYPASGADMFRRVSQYPKQRVTIYLFPHEVQYARLLALPRPLPVPEAPKSAPRRRLGVPELRPGRALVRPARGMVRVWDLGIAPPGVAREAQFQGIRRIDDELFYVWSARGVLYAQPRRAG